MTAGDLEDPDLLARFPVTHVVIRPEMAPADFDARYAELRDAIIAEYQPANRERVRSYFADGNGGFFAAPTQRAADLLGEYYALQQLAMRTDLHARIRTGLAFPVAIVVEPGTGAGARVVREAGSPRDVIFITELTSNATLASAMAALVAARHEHGGIPLDAWTHDVAPTASADTPAEFATVLARARSLPLRTFHGIAQPCVRVLLGGTQNSGDGADPRCGWRVSDM